MCITVLGIQIELIKVLFIIIGKTTNTELL